VISQVLNDEPKRVREIRPDISEEFEAIVLRALEKDREKRYQSTEEILADINALLEDPTRSTQRPRITAPRRIKPRGGATRVLAWVVGVAVIIAAVAVTVSFTMGGKSKAPAAAADAGHGAAVIVDAGAAKPAAVIDGASAAPEIEIWITTSPAHATVYDNANGRVFRTPFPLKIAADAEPLTLETDLDGYESSTFTVDPKKDASHADQKHALVEKLTKKKAGSTGGGRPHGNNDTPPHDSGGGDKPPPPTDVHCPGDVKPNPITHKCPEG